MTVVSGGTVVVVVVTSLAIGGVAGKRKGESGSTSMANPTPARTIALINNIAAGMSQRHDQPSRRDGGRADGIARSAVPSVAASYSPVSAL